jgi:hypothetical protein
MFEIGVQIADAEQDAEVLKDAFSPQHFAELLDASKFAVGDSQHVNRTTREEEMLERVSRVIPLVVTEAVSCTSCELAAQMRNKKLIGVVLESDVQLLEERHHHIDVQDRTESDSFRLCRIREAETPGSRSSPWKGKEEQ